MPQQDKNSSRGSEEEDEEQYTPVKNVPCNTTKSCALCHVPVPAGKEPGLALLTPVHFPGPAPPDCGPALNRQE